MNTRDVTPIEEKGVNFILECGGSKLECQLMINRNEFSTLDNIKEALKKRIVDLENNKFSIISCTTIEPIEVSSLEDLLSIKDSHFQIIINN